MASEDIQTLENDSNKESKILNQVEVSIFLFVCSYFN